MVEMGEVRQALTDHRRRRAFAAKDKTSRAGLGGERAVELFVQQFGNRRAEVTQDALRFARAVDRIPRQQRQIFGEIVAAAALKLTAETRGPVLAAALPAIDVQA